MNELDVILKNLFNSTKPIIEDLREKSPHVESDLEKAIKELKIYIVNHSQETNAKDDVYS